MFAIAFGGLLASGIAKMDGISGLQNWRWVFILEGLVTVVVGVFTFFLVPDFPEQSVWLTDAEREHLKEIAGVKEPSRVEFKDFGRFFDDFKRVLGAFMYFGIITPAYCEYDWLPLQLIFTKLFSLRILRPYYYQIARLQRHPDSATIGPSRSRRTSAHHCYRNVVRCGTPSLSVRRIRSCACRSWPCVTLYDPSLRSSICITISSYDGRQHIRYCDNLLVYNESTRAL